MTKLKVLYIAGSTRSGSTLLDNMLGEIDGFFATGELRLIWKQMLDRDTRCVCGELFADCRVWRTLLESALHSTELETIKMTSELWADKSKSAHYASVASSRKKGSLAEDYAPIVELLTRAYSALQNVTGAMVIVDSSKQPLFGAFVEAVPGVEFYVLHLTRDSRATVYSWLRRKPVPGTDRVLQRSATAAAAQWLAWNVISGWLWQGSPRYLRLRYEDLVTDPRRSLRAILSLVGEADRLLPLESDRMVAIGEHHTIPGNPDRFRTGLVEIRPDLEWKKHMRPRDWAYVTALTWPLLLKYGYANPLE